MPPDALGAGIAALPPSPFASPALERLRDAAGRQGAAALLEDCLARPGLADFLGTALGDCPYLLELSARDVTRVIALLEAGPAARVQEQISALRSAGWESRAEAMAALRKAKQNVALTLGLADLAGVLSLEGVTSALTDFADAALGAALRFALADAARAGKWAGGGAESCGFFLLAMGKYGAGELNYSSDIDLIALFEPSAPGLPPGAEPTTFWVRIVRTLVALMQERTADGYVFRTDLRLRPDPGATSVALAAPAALLYYESMGQNWERAALIKARACAGDIRAGQAFLAEIAPFIWRKYLDFAAIADIHSIKRQVHAHKGHEAVRVLRHDIKRGRGGIREIEFFVQTQQLIAGGRDRELRTRRTREGLALLAKKGWIDAEVSAELDAAYVFLRQVEHRLQMVRDEQTHTMPADTEGLARIGRLMSFAAPEAFEAELRRVLTTVARRYSELFEGAPELATETGSLVFTGGEDDPETIETLRRLGFQDPPQVAATIRAWHFGRFPAMRSAAAREGLTEITPALLAAFARAGNPDAALRAFDTLLRALPAGAQLFALLANNRELLDLLATILGAAPRLAEIFTRQPHVVDALIDPAAFADAQSADALAAKLDARLAEAAGYEDALDRVRRFAAEERFGLSVRLLRGEIDGAEAGKGFSELAECVVRSLFHQTLAEFERQHGRLPGGEAAVLAFGRLGSREMTAGSDLDLIVAYDHVPDAGPSDGRRPLAPSHYYTRLTQRLTAAISAPTAEGIAYAVDLRLRPSGRAGPLATHIEAFQHYQLEEAWTWEHMAMSRGRPIAGSARLCRRIDQVLDQVVAKPRDRARLAAEIADMRGRIAREKPSANCFDVKLASGGLVDCDFAAQFLLLSGLARRPGETTAETLARAADEDRLGKAEADALVAAARLQTAILQVQRIAEDKPFDPQSAPDAMKRLLAGCAAQALEDRGPGGGEPAGFDAIATRLPSVQEEARLALERVLGTPIP